MIDCLSRTLRNNEIELGSCSLRSVLFVAGGPACTRRTGNENAETYCRKADADAENMNEEWDLRWMEFGKKGMDDA